MFKKLVLVIGLLIVSIFTFNLLQDNECSNLERIALSEEELITIKNWVKKIATDPDLMKGANKERGVIYIENTSNYLGGEWEHLLIPLNLLTVEFRGRKINYQNFKFEDVVSIAIGYGQRKHLILSLNDSDSFGIPDIKKFEQNIKMVSNDIMLMCR